MVRGQQAQAPPRLRVLVADDEESIRLLCRLNLESDRIEVVEAADGQQAIERAVTAPPDVAVLDVMMPHLDGWQVAAYLREHEATTEAALIFLTALSAGEVEARVAQFGGVYLGKPFNPVALLAIVKRAAATRT